MSQFFAVLDLHHHHLGLPEAGSVHNSIGRHARYRSHSDTSRARKRTFDSILKYGIIPRAT
jgi:hypothetical protein